MEQQSHHLGTDRVRGGLLRNGRSVPKDADDVHKTSDGEREERIKNIKNVPPSGLTDQEDGQN